MGMRITLKKDEMAQLLVMLYILLRFISMFIPPYHFVILLYVMVGLLPVALVADFRLRADNRFLLSVGAFLLSGLLCAVFQHSGYTRIILELPMIVVGICIAKYGLKLSYLYVLYYTSMVIVLFRMIINNLDSNAVFYHGSRNMITAWLIMITCLLYLEYARSKKIVPIYPAVITTAVCFISGGRSGVVASVFLTAMLLLYNIRFTSKHPLRILGVVIAGIAGLSVAIRRYYSVFFEGVINRFKGIGYAERVWYENERLEYITDYLTKMVNSLKNFLLGVPAEEMPILNTLNGELHNSYLALHKHFGIIGFLIIAVFIFRVLKVKIKKKNAVFIIVTLTLLIRMFFETIAFTSFYDFVIFALAYIPYVEEKERVKDRIWVNYTEIKRHNNVPVHYGGAK